MIDNKRAKIIVKTAFINNAKLSILQIYDKIESAFNADKVFFRDRGRKNLFYEYVDENEVLNEVMKHATLLHYYYINNRLPLFIYEEGIKNL